MTEHYNQSTMPQRRRALRKNLPEVEIILWSKLSRKQMFGYKFRRQYSVDQYEIDFYCPELKLAIEIDGDSHFMPGAEDQDKARQEYIEAYGMRFLRFTNPDICENLDGVCQMIYQEIDTLENRKAETK
jgi:very-short-patch-repair endonuclease